ncbi:MAG TPA: FecR domain-containing protein [Lunatimonas sp.]|nr:FecR domain-containing protein [Lunatimonas sp.]
MKKKFADLFKKYKENTLSRREYDEFLEILGQGGLSDLDRLLDKTWKELAATSDRQSGSSRIKANPAWKYAAAASILGVLAVAAWLIMPFWTEPSDLLTYSAPFGEVREVSLPDGSLVSLNANSEISWHKDWKSSGQRTVLLKGEAFFDIESLPDQMPFVVETGEVTLKVIGTSFNVNHRTETVEIYLDEGLLNVHLKGTESDAIEMVPGDRLHVNPAKKEVDLVPNHTLIQAASWKKGVLNFRDQTLAEVLVKLTQIYGKEFVSTDSSLLAKELYVGVPYADWETVRQALELSLNIRFNEKDHYVKLELNP